MKLQFADCEGNLVEMNVGDSPAGKPVNYIIVDGVKFISYYSSSHNEINNRIDELERRVKMDYIHTHERINKLRNV